MALTVDLEDLQRVSKLQKVSEVTIAIHEGSCGIVGFRVSSLGSLTPRPLPSPIPCLYPLSLNPLPPLPSLSALPFSPLEIGALNPARGSGRAL